MKKSLGPSWNQPFLILLIIISCSSICNTAPLHETTDLEQYPGKCYYNYNHYNEGDKISTNEPCLNCTCHNKMLMCYLRVCPFTKPIGHDCIVEKREDQCCPIITCPDVPVELIDHKTSDSKNELGFSEKFGCYIDSKFYPEGAQVPSNPHKPCELCYCIKNRTSCLMQECTLHVDGCQPIYNRGVCCPVRYDCDHDSISGPYLEDSHTTVRPTEGFILTTVPSMKETTSCVYNELVFSDGALIPDTKACEHCYCMKGDIVCAVQECDMPLENAGKNCTFLPPSEDECCPKTYICQTDEDTELNSLAENNDISPQGASLLTTTVLPDVSDSGSVPQNLHETVSEEDVQLQEHIDDIPKTSTSKTTEVETSLDGASTVTPGSNIKFAQENDLDAVETTTQFEVSNEEDEIHRTDLPSSVGSSQDSAIDSTTEFAPKIEDSEKADDKLTTEISGATNENINDSIPEHEAIPITDSPESVNILPNEIIPIAIPGEGDCLYDNITYKNNSIVPEITICDVHCICLSSIIKCKKMECVAPTGSHCTPIENDSTDTCCPTYKCDKEQEIPVEGETPSPDKTVENLATTLSPLDVEEKTDSTSSYSGGPSNKKDEDLSNLQENQETANLGANSEPDLPEPTPTEITSFNLIDKENDGNSQQVEDHTELNKESGQKEEHAGDVNGEGIIDEENLQPVPVADKEQEVQTEKAVTEKEEEVHTQKPVIEKEQEIPTEKPVAEKGEEIQTGKPVIEKEEEVHTEKPVEDDLKPEEEHKEEGEKELAAEDNKGDKEEISHIEDHTEQAEKDRQEVTNENVPAEDHTEAVHKTDVALEVVTALPGDETQTVGTTEAVDTLVDKIEPEDEKPAIELDSSDKESPAPTDQPQIEVTTEVVLKLESEDKEDLLEGENKEPEIEDTTDSVTQKAETDVQQPAEVAPHQHAQEVDEEIIKPHAEDTTEVINEENEADLLDESNKNQEEPEAYTVGTIYLDRKHIDGQGLESSTDSSTNIPLESESHVTTSSPVKDVKGAPVDDEQDLENIVQVQTEEKDQDVLKPGAINEDIITEQPLSEQSTDSIPSVTPLGDLVIKDDNIKPESENTDDVKLHTIIEEQLVTSPQPDVEKDLTTEELMSAVQDVLKVTEISSTDEPEIINLVEKFDGSTEKPVQEHVVEPAGEHIEEPGSDDQNIPVSGHVAESIDDISKTPVVVEHIDQHDEKPVDEHVEDHTEEQVEDHTAEHVEDHTEQHVKQPADDVEDSVLSHVTEPVDNKVEDQIVDKTEPSIVMVDGLDYTTEIPIKELSQQSIDEGQHVVPDDINIQDPNVDKDHIFNMIIDNLEEQTTIQPLVTEGQQEIIKVESSSEHTPDIQLPTVQSILPSEGSVTERVDIPTKHTELTGIIEQNIKDEEAATPTEEKDKVPKTPLIHEILGVRPTDPSKDETHADKVESVIVTTEPSLPQPDNEDKLETVTSTEGIDQDEVVDSTVQPQSSSEFEAPIDKDDKTTLKTPESPQQEEDEAHGVSESAIITTELPLREEDQPQFISESHIPNIAEENVSLDSVVSQTEQSIIPVKKEDQLPESATTASASPVDSGIEGQLPESNTVASTVDETIKEELPESNTTGPLVDETNKEQLGESTSSVPAVDETIKEQLPEGNIVAFAANETIKEQLPESNTAATTAEVQLLESSTAISAEPAPEESPKPEPAAEEIPKPELNEVVQPSAHAEEGSGDSTTQLPISNQISTEATASEPEHTEIHPAAEDVKPEHESFDHSTLHTESELSSTIKTDVEEHQTESSLPVGEVTPKENVPSAPVDSVSQTTTELYESLNKTEEDKISEIVTPEEHEESSTAHSTVHVTPETHHLPASEEAIDTEDNLSTHSTSSHPASSFGVGDLDTQTEPSLGPLPGGHYSSFNEDDYGEEEDPGAFGPGTCRYGGKLFVSAQQIPRDDPCDFCFCFRSDIICLQQSCPPPISGCHEEPIQGFCCPRYECPVSMGGVLNLTTTTTTTTTLPPHFMHRPSDLVKRTGCYIGGQTFKVGEAIESASGPCIQCSCGGDGQMKCEPKVCTPEPMLRQMIAVVASRRR